MVNRKDQETELEQSKKALRRRAILEQQDGKALYKVSRAYALFIPQLWLRLNGFEVDDRMWVKVELEDEKIIISPIDQEEALKSMEVNDARQ